MKKLLVIFAVLLIVAVLATVAGILLSGGGRSLVGPTVLVWRLDRPVLEQVAATSFPFAEAASDSMGEIWSALRAARDDDGVRGLAVYIQDTAFGLAKAQELRRQLLAMRDSGKFVECYLETAGEGSNGTLAYFLATACEKIHLAPAGDVNLLGLYVDSMFLRGTLEKLKIEPDFSHVGEYKSYSEIFTESEHSPAAQEALEAVLDGYYGQIVSTIAGARKRSPDEVRSLIDGAPYDAREALEKGLVDDLIYPDEFRDRLTELAGAEPRLVRLQDYDGGTGLGARRLAVVFAPGTIVRGAGGTEPLTEELFLGSEDTAELLRQLAEDSTVAAVVLRVDSPGGSALASDLILREVEKLVEAKPVVVSMSDVAASGGYYIAAKASKIVAEEATLTGSIGVVGGKFVTRRLQEETLGITHDELKRGANADLYSSLAPYSPEQAARVERLMQRVYDTFVGHVAAGRKMTREQVDAVAAGRVWTGGDAHRLGLVDELGGLDRAVELAREAAGIGAGQDLPIAFYPEPPSWLELLAEEREPLVSAAILKAARRVLEPRPRHLLEVPESVLQATRCF